MQGFDEFMNLVIDDAVEVKQITKTNEKETRKPLGKMIEAFILLGSIRSKPANTATGQILLKGDNVSLIQNLSN